MVTSHHFYRFPKIFTRWKTSFSFADARSSLAIPRSFIYHFSALGDVTFWKPETTEYRDLEITSCDLKIDASSGGCFVNDLTSDKTFNEFPRAEELRGVSIEVI